MGLGKHDIWVKNKDHYSLNTCLDFLVCPTNNLSTFEREGSAHIIEKDSSIEYVIIWYLGEK